MALNNQQLDSIKAFIAKRGFTHVDLQLELLDHVASRVEEKMEANPALSFDTALTETHREFGVFGFSGMEDGLRKSLERQYFQLALAEGKHWFEFPRVLLLVGFAVLIHQTYQMLPSTATLVMAVALNLVLIGHLFLLYYGFFKRFKNTLIVQSTTLYVLIPTFILQLWVHFYRYLDHGLTGGVVYTLALMLVVFAYRSAIRIQHQAVARCSELEGKYGVF